MKKIIYATLMFLGVATVSNAETPAKATIENTKASVRPTTSLTKTETTIGKKHKKHHKAPKKAPKSKS
jgi:hypothetical protein